MKSKKPNCLVFMLGLYLFTTTGIGATITVSPVITPTPADNDFTAISNAVTTAIPGDIIDLQGTFNWTEPNAYNSYLNSYTLSPSQDIRGIKLPNISDLTITSSPHNAVIIGAGDINDGALIFSSCFYNPGTAAVHNLTVTYIHFNNFEGGITLNWEAFQFSNNTIIEHNTFTIAGDDGDATDWIQNIAVYTGGGINKKIRYNTFNFLSNGTRTQGYSGPAPGACFGYQSATNPNGYNGLEVSYNDFQVDAVSVPGNLTFGIWENSHSDQDNQNISLAYNTFTGRTGDDFSRAFILSSQSDLLSIDHNIFDRVDNLYFARNSSGVQATDVFTFTNSVCTNIGGADGIFLQNVTETNLHIGINWPINNTVDGETGIRGLNELSIQATYASRPSSGATDLDKVIALGNKTVVGVDDNWGTPGRFTDPDGIGTGMGPIAYGFNTFSTIQAGINELTSNTVYVAAGTYPEQILINRPLTVSGLDGAVLDGTGLAPTWTTGVKIKSGNVTFNNIDVTNYKQDGIICGYEASIPGNLPNIHITNCKVSNIQPGYWGFGIYVGYESEGFGYTPPKLTAHLDYSGLLIENNEITNTHSSALVLQSITGTPGTLQVRNNNIHDNTTNSGIWLDCARNFTIEDNIVSANKWGIEFTAYAESWYTLNGPYSPQNITVTGNQIINNTEDGIALYNGWPATINVHGNIISGNTPGAHNYLAEYMDASLNYWGDPTGPFHAVNNPGGLGNAVSDYVLFEPWYTDPGMTQTNDINIGIFETTCGDFEVRVTPFSSISGQFLTNVIFTVAWDGAPAMDLINVVSDYGVVKYYTQVVGSTKYIVFYGESGIPVNWTAGTEYVLCTFSHNEAASGTADFAIAADAWTAANNADWYIELNGLDNTGLIYADAPGVFLGSCDAQIKVFVAGAYSASTHLMRNDIYDELQFPLTQPYNTAPWNYAGTESVLTVDPGVVDWVLVELRTGIDESTVFERKAGFLLQNGTIAQFDDVSHGIRFDNVVSGEDYYIVVWHRNHIPVMSAAAVALPNASVFDFSVATNAYKHLDPLPSEIALETGVFGLFAGDIDANGQLKYSGANNDRSYIILRIFANGGSQLFHTTTGYYPEDVTLDYTVSYTGAGNDRDAMLPSLNYATQSIYLNAVYNSVVPGAYGAKDAASSGSGPVNAWLTTFNDELVLRLNASEIVSGWIDNVQVTMAWKTSDSQIAGIIGKYASDYGLSAQGPAFIQGDISYQVFVTVSPFQIPEGFGDKAEIDLLTFDLASNINLNDRVWIADDGFTSQINGTYYVSVFGKDNTGQVYSPKLAVEPGVNVAGVSVFPNPVTSNTFHVTMQLNQPQNLTFEILDLQGKVIASFTENASGFFTGSFDVSSIVKGVYMLRITGHDINVTQKLIIQ